jgi:hypothetical protein
MAGHALVGRMTWNDGPVPTEADVAIAVGSATDLARETTAVVPPPADCGCCHGCGTASSHHLMRVLGAVVLAQALLMARRESELPSRAPIGRQLVRHEHARSIALLLQKLAHELQAAALSGLGCRSTSRISPSLSAARQRYVLPPCIEITTSSKCHVSAGRDLSRRRFLAMAGPNLITHRRVVSYEILSPPLGEKLLDIPGAKGEPEIEPDGVPDDLGRDLVARI